MTTLHKVGVGDTTIEYTLRRSSRRRKTVQISVSKGTVTVSAPMRTPNNEIRAILQKRLTWILGKLESTPEQPPALSLASGEKLPYLGRDLTLVVTEDDVRKSSAILYGQQLVVTASQGLTEDSRTEVVRAALLAWYKTEATELLTESVARWLPVMGLSEMPRVLVKEQKTRWGSCSADGTLIFSWRLAMVEPDLIDSVAVHELAHLEVMNHSQAFWDVVLRVMPDAKERRRRLAHAGRNLPL